MNLKINEQKLLDAGYPDVIVFRDPDFDGALIGVTYDSRAVYDYGLMVRYLMESEGLSEEQAEDYIECNTLGATVGVTGGPVVMYRLW